MNRRGFLAAVAASLGTLFGAKPADAKPASGVVQTEDVPFLWSKACALSDCEIVISDFPPLLTCKNSAGPFELGDHLLAKFLVDEPGKPLTVRRVWFRVVGVWKSTNLLGQRIFLGHVHGGQLGDIIPTDSAFINFGQGKAVEGVIFKETL